MFGVVKPLNFRGEVLKLQVGKPSSIDPRRISAKVTSSISKRTTLAERPVACRWIFFLKITWDPECFLWGLKEGF